MVLEIGPNATEVVIALITLVGSIVAAFAAYYARKANNKAAETHDLVNSRMTELLGLTRDASRAEGVVAGAKGETPGAAIPQSVTIVNSKKL